MPYQYYDAETRAPVGEAWSISECDDVKRGRKHGPHPFERPAPKGLAPLGASMCKGYPNRALYNGELKKEKK